jgi:hypothetical protein
MSIRILSAPEMEVPMSNRSGPCKGCEDRYTACSAHCQKEAYLKWRAELALIKKNRESYVTPIWKHGDRDCRKK